MTSTFIQDGLSRLLEQFHRSPVLRSWLTSYLTQVDALRVASLQLINERAIYDAVGQQLNVIGDIVGKARGSFDDPTYRAWILATIRSNSSSGHASDLIAIVRHIITDPLVTLFIEDEYPAALTFHCEGIVEVEEGNALGQALQIARAAGVRLLFSYSPETNVFRYADASFLGLGEDGAASGGYDDGGYAQTHDGRDLFGDNT